MTQNTTPVTGRVVDLASLPAGTRGVIHAVHGGRGLATRLATMGFTAGTEVTVMQNYGHGPIIVFVRGTRVALGRGEARRILVTVSR